MALTADKELFYEKSETWKRYFENDVVLSVLKEEIDYLYILNFTGNPESITNRAKLSLVSPNLMKSSDVFEFCYSCIEHCLSAWEAQNPGKTWLADTKTTLRNWIDRTGEVTDKDLIRSWPEGRDIINNPTWFAKSVITLTTKIMGISEFGWQVDTLIKQLNENKK